MKALGLQDMPQAVRLRFVRVRLSGGRIMVLVTSLTDQSAYPLDAFAHLYGQRWGIEIYQSYNLRNTQMANSSMAFADAAFRRDRSRARSCAVA